jgi:hypothetical protein
VVPGIDLRLEVVTPGEQCLVLRCQLGDDLAERRPERIRRDAGPRGDVVGHQIMEGLGDLEIAVLDAFGHVASLVNVVIACGSAGRPGILQAGGTRKRRRAF